jgi:hypothetical protein
MDEWRGVDFPRDREIMIRLDLTAPAHWDKKLACWVLRYPVHVETVHRPYAWKPLKSEVQPSFEFPPTGEITATR